MLGQVNRGGTRELHETKVSIRRLVEVYDRMDRAIESKFNVKIGEYGSRSAQSSDKEAITREVRKLNDGLSDLIKVAAKRQESFRNTLEMAKRFEESNSVEEISTLIGVTMLADYKGHADGLDQVSKICESKIYPGIQILTNLVGFAAELDKICKWTHKILNYDPASKEDDIVRMVSSIRSGNIEQFNAIYQRLNQNLGAEESP
jgi:hypothetical protein